MQTGFRFAIALSSLGLSSIACARTPAHGGAAQGAANAAVETRVAPPLASTAPISTAEPSTWQPTTHSSSSAAITSAPSAPTGTTEATPPLPRSLIAVSPPFERSAQRGDGEWTALTDASWEGRFNHPIAHRTRLHPHPISRFVTLDVVAIDLNAVSLHWVVGKKDAGAERLSEAMKPGIIAEPEQAQVLAIFNGGFQARHGWWGMHSHDVTLVPLKEHGCTVALTASGEVRLGEWATLQLEAPAFLTLRQTPPCLVAQGNIHPGLLQGNTRPWAGENPKRKTRRRSALGIDATQSVLYYAIGTETSALDLARGMAALGVETALQLDINWSWTRFLIVGRQDGRPRVTATLIEDTVHGKNEYFTWPADRDFFYLTARAVN